MRLRSSALMGASAFVLALACAGGPPPPPAAGKAAVWGYLKLVPHAGSGGPTANAYGDSRLRDAQRFDYSRPGFAVVYLVGGEAGPVRAQAPRTGTSRDVELTIDEGTVGARLSPRHAALRQGDRIVAENRTDADQVLAAPSLSVVKPLAPGESVVLALPRSGEHAVHLLGASGETTTLFVAAGPYDTVSSTGRFVLQDIEPGEIDLRSWHPRLPPSRTHLTVRAGEVVRMDLELGVGLDAGETDAPRASDGNRDRDQEFHRASN